MGTTYSFADRGDDETYTVSLYKARKDGTAKHAFSVTHVGELEFYLLDGAGVRLCRLYPTSCTVGRDVTVRYLESQDKAWLVYPIIISECRYIVSQPTPRENHHLTPVYYKPKQKTTAEATDKSNKKLD